MFSAAFPLVTRHSQVMRLWIFLERWNGALAWLSFLVFNLVVVRCLLWSRLCVAYWLSKISPATTLSLALFLSKHTFFLEMLRSGVCALCGENEERRER